MGEPPNTQSQTIFEYFYKPIFIGVLLFGVSFPFWDRGRNRIWNERLSRLFLYNLFVCIGLFLIFLPLLLLYIREQFEVYHFANVFICVLVISALIFRLLFEKLRKEYRGPFTLAVVLTIGASISFNLIYPRSFSADFYRSDLKSALSEMVKDTGGERSFYLTEVCVRGSETWCPDEPFYVNFYLSSSISDRQRSNSIFPKKDVLKFHRDSFVIPFKTDRIYFLIHDMKSNRRDKLLKYLKNLSKSKNDQMVIASEGYLIWGYPSESSDSRPDILSGLHALERACGLFDSDCYWVKATMALMKRSMVASIREAEFVKNAFRQEFYPPKPSFHRGADVDRILSLLESDPSVDVVP